LFYTREEGVECPLPTTRREMVPRCFPLREEGGSKVQALSGDIP